MEVGSRMMSRTSPGHAGGGVSGSSPEQQGGVEGPCGFKEGWARGRRWARMRGEERRLAASTLA